MEKAEIYVKQEVDLHEPVLIEGLPGLGLVGKLAAEHLVSELKAKKFA
ncbi:MAG: PAC2 family protein, partial [Candidatus Micrarchaeota archaeon]